MRKLLEVLSRRVRFVRRLPSAFGSQRLHVSPAASLAMWRWDVASADPQLLWWARALVEPGMVVWDIGANCGIFSFAAAFLAGPGGHVVSVEADPWLASLLRRSTGLHDCVRADVTVVEAAVLDRQAPVSFCIASRGRSANHLAAISGSSQAGGTRKTLEVRGTTLDALLDGHPAPDLVKIDVEGAEGLCLAGGERLIRCHRPIVLCEVHDGNRDAVTEFLAGREYFLLDAEGNWTDARPVTIAPWNTLAVPHSAINGRRRPGTWPCARVTGD